jgi:hypothetical protein
VRKVYFAALVAIGALSGGCSSDPHFDHLFYSNVSSAPGRVSLRPRSIEIDRGLAVSAQVYIIGDDGAPMASPSFQSSDTTIFEVDLGPDSGQFVFYGVEVGAAEMDVFSEYGFEATLPVTVLAASAASAAGAPAAPGQ